MLSNKAEESLNLIKNRHLEKVQPKRQNFMYNSLEIKSINPSTLAQNATTILIFLKQSISLIFKDFNLQTFCFLFLTHFRINPL